MNVVAEKYQASITERSLAFSGLIASIAGLLVVRSFNPTNAGFFPQCPFYVLTGLACPGCGLTRGTHALLNGNVLSALGFNAMLIILVPVGIYAFLALLSIAVRGRGLPRSNISTNVFWAIFAAFIIFGVLRNLPFYPFTVLAP